MTDEQIIKALDCCHSEFGNMCSICPLFDPDNDYCEDELHKDALNLINRQKAELERLKKNIDGLNIFTTNHIKVIRVQAIKEFAERLKIKVKMYNSEGVDEGDLIDDLLTEGETVEIIDNLVKEMTEAQE